MQTPTVYRGITTHEFVTIECKRIRDQEVASDAAAGSGTMRRDTLPLPSILRDSTASTKNMEQSGEIDGSNNQIQSVIDIKAYNTEGNENASQCDRNAADVINRDCSLHSEKYSISGNRNSSKDKEIFDKNINPRKVNSFDVIVNEYDQRVSKSSTI